MDPVASRACEAQPSTTICGEPLSRCPAEKGVTGDHSHLQRNRRGWRHVVLNFTPSWFAVNMGTGIVSILLHNLPYNARWLYWISVVIFSLNVVLFLVFLTISILRYTLFEGVWKCMIRHPTQSLFLGTFPMGLATIVNMVVFVCVPAWGTHFVTLAWVLWWIDVVLSVATNFYLPFVIMYKHETQLQTMTAAWLLPIVSTIVAAASGGIVASVLSLQNALITIVTSYILWGCGVPLAMFTMVIYFQRLTMHQLPPREVIVSVFLPLGPLGQGSFGIMQIGAEALRISKETKFIPNAPVAGQILYTMGIATAFVMWGFGLVWLFFALASISRRRFPFNLGWWGFTFPLGVYSTATTMFAKELPSGFFKVLGTIFSLLVVLLWIIVSIGTFHQAFFGQLVFAPCIPDWVAQQEKKDNNKSGELA
ncbi:hypothetical protein NLG97_g4233 [Lecanicillium saksenae]|uniref:Uncharacterized protein n=1 Tax=Lecanicillium saksenae TaxID=468837 RepID=A0ACC1QXN9_9HYPO|nr:hypothetical protein NLG97_g4233 [Lecanicillium saksenae]